MTGSVITVLLFLLVGSAISRLTGGMQWFAAGCGVVGLTLHVWGLFGLPITPVIAALVIAASVTLIATRRRPAGERVAYPLLPTILTVLPAVWLLAVTAVVPLRDFDGRAFWLLKSKAIVQQGAIAGPFFQGGTTSPRNEYPLLMPLSTAAVMTLAGEADERHVRWIYALLAIAFALELRRRIGRIVSPSAGAWAGALFLWLPQIAIEIEGGATSAYNDIAVGVFAAAALFELIERGSPLRFGLWVAFITLTKSEGLPLSILLMTLGVVVFRRHIAAALIPHAGALVTLFEWRGRVSRSDELDFASLILTLPRNVGRFGESLLAVSKQLVALHDWGLLLCAAAIGTLLLVRRREWRTLGLAAAVVVPMLLLYSAVFAVSDWHMDVMRDNLAPRVMTHLLGPIFLLVFAPLAGKAASGSPDVRALEQVDSPALVGGAVRAAGSGM